jgi:signal transduction histidine kinase
MASARIEQADGRCGSPSGADAERRRWASELHEEALQALDELRLLLLDALGRVDPKLARTAMREAVVQIEQEMENLRAIATEVSLDELQATESSGGSSPRVECLDERARPDERTAGRAEELREGSR